MAFAYIYNGRGITEVEARAVIDRMGVAEIIENCRKANLDTVTISTPRELLSVGFYPGKYKKGGETDE